MQDLKIYLKNEVFLKIQSVKGLSAPMEPLICEKQVTIIVNPITVFWQILMPENSGPGLRNLSVSGVMVLTGSKWRMDQGT